MAADPTGVETPIAPRTLWTRLVTAAPWAAAVLSGLTQFAAFPPLESGQLAFVGLAPLVAAVFLHPRRGFRLGLVAGAAFWLPSVFWLTRVTWAGWAFLAMYCALYHGLFGAFVGAWARRFGAARLTANVGLMAAATAVFVGLEFIRSNVLTGFPWNQAGVALFRQPVLIQWAAWGGVSAVSALVVWVNTGLALTALRLLRPAGPRWQPSLELFLALGALMLALFTGWRVLRTPPAGAEPLRVALIQTGIPQDEKWDQAKVEMIYARLDNLTRSALVLRPDLVVWPETALPDDLRGSQTSYDLVYRLATNGSPLLVGSMDTEWPDNGRQRYYNVSFLVDARGVIVGEYRKQHLVPFGEYVPYGRFLPFLKAMTPIQESFDPGTTAVVFRAFGAGPAFTTVICFEDTVAALARAAVRAGARMLVNQTNDAWFDPLWGSRQHMSHCVFRCVENGVPAIRCANSGVTCHIGPSGRIVELLAAPDGSTAFPGFIMVEPRLPPADMPLTPYTRHGDRFAWSCALAGAALSAALRRLRPAEDARA